MDKVCHIPTKGPDGINDDALKRLRRAEGQVRGIIRPIVVTGILFSFSAILSNELSQTETTSGLLGWIKFGLLACITAAFFLIISFFIGLSFQQRRVISDRIRTVIFS